MRALGLRLRRLEAVRSRDRCPCGQTDTWTGWAPLILGAGGARNEELAEAPPKCPRCGGLVPRLTMADLQALVTDLER